MGMSVSAATDDGSDWPEEARAAIFGCFLSSHPDDVQDAANTRYQSRFQPGGGVDR
jgi:hypothetical protein